MRDQLDWEALSEKAEELINEQIEKETKLLSYMVDEYANAKSHADFKRIGLTIRKSSLRVERLKSSDYFYDVRGQFKEVTL
jgi:hypothetical protein